MSTVHKFKRPPKNEQQFRGYRPRLSNNAARSKRSLLTRAGWRQTAVVWSALVIAATVFWAAGALI